MKRIYITLFSLTLLLASCKSDADNSLDSASFPIEYTTNYQLVFGKPFEISLKSTQDIASVDLYLEDSLIKQWKGSDLKSFSVDMTFLGIGNKRFRLVAKTKSGEEFTENQSIRILSDITPEIAIAKPIATFPHTESHFTQGLEIRNGFLYEGTGDPMRIGATKVMKKNLLTNEVLQETNLDASYFGEGITILADKIYQITWTSQTCFVYDLETLTRQEKSFTYSGEGWGLANDGKQLIMSDGSERITFRNPADFSIQRMIQVFDNAGPVKHLNELEYIEGFIYANVWMTSKIVVIEPATGRVVKTIDCSEIVSKYQGEGDVMNGIAYDKNTKKIYLTGKYWKNIISIEI